jgi:hypothetical protein
MSLPARQQRVLGGIEQALLADDPRLRSLFAFFTSLTRHDAMPGTEQITPGLRQPLQPIVVISVTLIVLASVLMVSLLGAGRNPGAATGAAAEPAQPAGRTAGWPPRPTITLDRQYLR